MIVCIAMDRADGIWNRACDAVQEDETADAGRAGAKRRREGDRALTAMVMADGLVQNGGVLHAVESLEPSETETACKAFEYYGLRPAAEVLRRAAREAAEGDEDRLEEIEEELDEAYSAVVSNEDGTLEAAFREHLRQRPDAYAPLDETDIV